MNTIKYTPLSVIFFVAFSLQAASFENSLLLNATRVIYKASDKKGVVFSVTNNGSLPYLLQARIRENSQDPKKDIPFIITPPLKRLAPQESVRLRIIYAGDTLPRDRESVFSLVLKQIPAQDLNHTSKITTVSVATQNTLKLFYRPAEIEERNADKERENVVFKKEPDSLAVSNPTPFWVTFESVSLNKHNIDIDNMIPPFGRSVMPLKEKTEGGSLEWTTINDNGYPSEPKVERVK
nr:molecular chaperone [uncultured Cedecea sp.]